MKRIINNHAVIWVGDTQITVSRLQEPKHEYQFETSPDRKLLKRLYSTSPVDVSTGDPLLNAEQFEEEARAVVNEYIELEKQT